MARTTAQMKIIEYEVLRQRAHRKVDALTKGQLKIFVKNGREYAAPKEMKNGEN